LCAARDYGVAGWGEDVRFGHFAGLTSDRQLFGQSAMERLRWTTMFDCWRIRAAVMASMISIFLTGCAGIRDSMKPMIGQPVGAVADKLGYPSDQRVIGGRTVYIWRTSNLYKGTELKCEIRAIVDAQDKIVGMDFDGNEFDCSNYAQRLGHPQ
jgi:hypothetical protein